MEQIYFPTLDATPFYPASPVSITDELAPAAVLYDAGNKRIPNNRPPQGNELDVIQHILTGRKALASQLETMIEDAEVAAKKLEVPYQDIKALYESAECAYSAAQQYLDALVAARGTMQPGIKRLRAKMDPIWRYPTDILTLVFIAVAREERQRESVLEYENVPLMPKYRRRHPALDLAHVCRAWRALALSIPELWSTVRVSLARRSKISAKMEFFATHAKAVPMKVIITNLQPSYFTHRLSPDNDEEDNQPPMLDSINNLSSLEVHFSHFRALSYLPRLGVHRLEDLQELALHNDPTMLSTPHEFSLSGYLSLTPNLRKLTICRVPLVLSMHDGTTTLSNLVQLIVHSPLNTHVANVTLSQYLFMCPNVIKLTYFENSEAAIELGEVSELHNLANLNVNLLALITLTGRLFCPSLRKLHVVSDAQDTSSPLSAFLSAHQSIQTLNITGDFDPITGSVDSTIFHQAPPLQTLLISRTHVGFIRLLGATDSHGSVLVLPFLTRLKMNLARHTTATMTSADFERLFNTRCIPAPDQEGITSSGAKQLSKLSLSTHDGLLEATRTSIERWMKCTRTGSRYLSYRWTGM
ncbi:hypothetical protein PIIN_00157 [Serendipita indica DSM 11827]|uniref:Uncharacterized protein n=1 Tax=Serendipita indica (strain DSM 11827) TaxID=1109443 RepID=G4T5A2_SERID|nr:hypothetical protein PIIN_00157 [Serendipita indica DSM 11827]